MLDELIFTDCISACKHFGINLGLGFNETDEEQARAYILLGQYLDQHNLSCNMKLSGEIKISNGQ